MWTSFTWTSKKKTQKKILFFPFKIIKINSLQQQQQKKSSETEIDFESKKNYHPGNIKINLKKNPKKKNLWTIWFNMANKAYIYEDRMRKIDYFIKLLLSLLLFLLNDIQSINQSIYHQGIDTIVNRFDFIFIYYQKMCLSVCVCVCNTFLPQTHDTTGQVSLSFE